MATARTSTSSNSPSNFLSQHVELQNAIEDFVTDKVATTLKNWQIEMKEEIENEIERRVAMAIAEFTDNTEDQRLINIIAKQTIVINKLLKEQTATTTNQIDLIHKIKELCNTVMEIGNDLKELTDQTASENPIYLDMNTEKDNLILRPTLPTSPETERQNQGIDPNLAFFASRIPFGLTCPPPEPLLVEPDEEETPQKYFTYGAPPKQIPDFPTLICHLFMELPAENQK